MVPPIKRNTKMSEENQELDQLTLLKERAKKMGIAIKGNPSIETVKQLIADHIGEDSDKADDTEDSAKTKRMRNKAIRDEAMKLVRVKITCMNPSKKNWQGEIISVGNKAIGTVKKYIPLQAETHEDGYHIPNVIYQYIKNKKYQTFKTIKHSNGEKTKKSVQVNEYAIAVLPQLTPKELAELKAAQTAKGGVSN